MDQFSNHISFLPIISIVIHSNKKGKMGMEDGCFLVCLLIGLWVRYFLFVRFSENFESGLMHLCLKAGYRAIPRAYEPILKA